MSILRAFRILLPCLLLLAVACAGRSASGAEGQPFPDLSFEAPEDPAQVRDLGLSGGTKTFKLSQVPKDYVLVQLFSAYCPHCQAEAPYMNQLHNLIRKEGLANKLVILGVGVGNNGFEVNMFRKKYDIRYPLVTDYDFRAYDSLERTGTPTYYLVRPDGDGQPRAIMRHVGRFTTPEEFLAQVRREAGI